MCLKLFLKHISHIDSRSFVWAPPLWAQSLAPINFYPRFFPVLNKCPSIIASTCAPKSQLTCRGIPPRLGPSLSAKQLLETVIPRSWARIFRLEWLWYSYTFSYKRKAYPTLSSPRRVYRCSHSFICHWGLRLNHHPGKENRAFSTEKIARSSDSCTALLSLRACTPPPERTSFTLFNCVGE